MRKLLPIILTFLISSYSNGQKKIIPTQIVLITSDTLNGTMKVETNAFDKELIYPSSFNKKVIFFDDLGNKRKIKSQWISELTFTDFHKKKRTFVKINEFKNRILEVIYSNKVSWYKDYNYDSYNHIEYIKDEFFDENRNQYTVGLFGNYKKKLRKLTKNNLDIKKFIKENKMDDENIAIVIKMYEKLIE